MSRCSIKRSIISKTFAIVQLQIVSFCIVIVAISKSNQVEGFHLSLGRRLLRSANNPQLNPASTLIRPIECRNANNHSEAGICMFSIDCMQNKGVPLSVCKHNYFVGTCCKLPDYNNFVGIVYDLRDTETNQILEARRISSGSPTSSTKSLSLKQDNYTETTSPVNTLDKEPKQQVASSTSPFSSPSSTIEPLKLEEKLDERYIISSTSLFSSTYKPTEQQHSDLLQDQRIQMQNSILTKIKTQSNPGESARNADGLVGQSVANLPSDNRQQVVIVPSELDSFQLQTTTNDNVLRQQVFQQANQNLHSPTLVSSDSKIVPSVESSNNSAYEMVKDDSLDVIGTITSAHSAPLSIQQQQPPATTIVEHSIRPSIQYEDSNNKSVYLVEDTSQQASNISANSTPSQSASSSTSPTIVSNTSQEFTLTSATSPLDSTNSLLETSPRLDNSASPIDIESKINLTNNSDSQTTIAFSQPQSASTSSSFVDLVSSNTAQTTTPFTTSLSTALLPNISSHPYSPTTETASSVVLGTTEPTSLVSNQFQNSYRISSNHSSLFQSSSKPDSTAESSHSSALGQLYSNQHSSSTPIHQYSHEHHPNQQHQKPGMTILNNPSSISNLIPSTKIVSGGSSANNLIPGLSGLQSAILSHIPFKIASGLSSGLSNYLQNAMKPTGQRPLLSSNNAPASQYQQSSSTSKPHNISSPSTTTISQQYPPQPGVRFPGSVYDSSASSTTNNLLVNQLVGSTISQSNQQELGRDVQQVCGRPIVSPLGSGEVGKKRVARIVGGNQSLFGQWPWMVSLRQLRKGAFLHKCGAALLNENWAITAAHCVENVKASDLLLRLGEFDVSHQDEPYPFMERRVKTVVSHPSFDPKTFEYDLALLRFTEPVKYERNIIPVCIPSGNDSYVDRMATVIGWGRLYEDGPLPDIIQHVDVPIITNNECEKMYKNAGYIEEIPDMFICAGISKGGRDSCEGDSGGPLTMVDHDGRSYLVGIISWGIGCALPSQPGVYTRITAFSGWINQIVANSS